MREYLAIVHRYIGIFTKTKGSRIDSTLDLAVTIYDQFLVRHPVGKQPPSPIFVTLFGPRGGGGGGGGGGIGAVVCVCS